MRRGCIAVQEVRCDECGRSIRYPERYLVMDVEDVPAKKRKEEGKKLLRYCVDCSLKRGYAEYRLEKGEKILTFLEVKE